MQGVNKYSELYNKRQQCDKSEQNTYIQFLETQMDKVTAAINITKNFDQRINDLENQNNLYREKIADMTKDLGNSVMIKEEENQNIRDILNEIRSKMDPQNIDQQIQLIQASLNQQFNEFDQQISQKLVKSSKNQDQKFQIFQDRLMNQVIHKYQNFGGLQDLIENKMSDLRKEINSKINCVFQEIKENITQDDLKDFYKQLQDDQQKTKQQIQDMEDRINQKQLFLNELTEELVQKFQNQNISVSDNQLQNKINQIFDNKFQPFVNEFQQEHIQQKQFLTDFEQYIDNKITISFDKLSEMFGQFSQQKQPEQEDRIQQYKVNKDQDLQKEFDISSSSISSQDLNQHQEQYQKQITKTLKKHNSTKKSVEKKPKPDKIKKFK